MMYGIYDNNIDYAHFDNRDNRVLFFIKETDKAIKHYAPIGDERRMARRSLR